MFQIVHQLIGSFRLARIIMQNAISCQLLFANERPQFPISLSFSLVAHGGRD